MPTPVLNRVGSNVEGRMYHACDIRSAADAAANATACSFDPVSPSSKL